MDSRGNPSAINYWTPKLPKMKSFGNFADSNRKAIGTQKKKTGSTPKPKGGNYGT